MGIFDAQRASPTWSPSITIARATFSVQAPGAVSLVYGLDESVLDGLGTLFWPSASADVVPQPSTAASLALGLCGLAVGHCSRHRR